MGKITPSGTDLATQAVATVFTAAGQVTAPACFQGHFNLFVGSAGAFTGTVRLEASHDGGATWLPLTAMGNAVSITAEAAEVLRQYEPGVLIRARCMALSAGTIQVRISQ